MTMARTNWKLKKEAKNPELSLPRLKMSQPPSESDQGVRILYQP